MGDDFDDLLGLDTKEEEDEDDIMREIEARRAKKAAEKAQQSVVPPPPPVITQPAAVVPPLPVVVHASPSPNKVQAPPPPTPAVAQAPPPSVQPAVEAPPPPGAPAVPSADAQQTGGLDLPDLVALRPPEKKSESPIEINLLDSVPGSSQASPTPPQAPQPTEGSKVTMDLNLVLDSENKSDEKTVSSALAPSTTGTKNLTPLSPKPGPTQTDLLQCMSIATPDATNWNDQATIMPNANKETKDNLETWYEESPSLGSAAQPIGVSAQPPIVQATIPSHPSAQPSGQVQPSRSNFESSKGEVDLLGNPVAPATDLLGNPIVSPPKPQSSASPGARNSGDELGGRASTEERQPRITNLLDQPNLLEQHSETQGSPTRRSNQGDDSPENDPFAEVIPVDKLVSGATAAKEFLSWGFSQVKEQVKELKEHEVTKSLVEQTKQLDEKWMASEARSSIVESTNAVTTNVRQGLSETTDVMKEGLAEIKQDFVSVTQEVHQSTKDVQESLKPALEEAKKGLKTFASFGASAAIWFQSMGRPDTHSDDEATGRSPPGAGFIP